MYDHVQRRWRLLSWCPSKEFGYVGRWGRRFTLGCGDLMIYLRREDLREAATLLVDTDVYTAVVCHHCIRAHICAVFIELSGDLSVRWGRLIWICMFVG